MTTWLLQPHKSGTGIWIPGVEVAYSQGTSKWSLVKASKIDFVLYDFAQFY